MAAEQHATIFLPYLRLKQPCTVAGVSFVPLRDEAGRVPVELQTGQAAIERILSSYVDRHGDEFTNCTVAVLPDKGWDLTDEDTADVNWAASLLFLATWSCNRYFSRFDDHYVNASHFRVIGQRFSGGSPVYITLSARRRDGNSMDGGYRHGKVKFNAPLQSSVRARVDVDTEFLDALDRAHAQKLAIAERLRTALPVVLLANTDDDFMLPHAEVILMGSAFEQVLHGKASAYRLARKLGELFKDFGSVRLKDAREDRPGVQVDDSAFAEHHEMWWLSRKWIEELYDLRSKTVHRGGIGGRPWGWTLFEHLVMAAHVFPLAVKLQLVKSGCYQLTDDDKAACLAIDPILQSPRWVEDRDEDDDGARSWHAILRRIRDDLRWERVHQSIREKHPEFFADAGPEPGGGDST